MTSRQSSLLRFPGLDTLRAVAITIVAVYHIGIQRLLPTALDPVVAVGWTGVDLFFVLSGFLIGSQLLRPYLQGGRPSLSEFYARRAYRILPAYFAVLALYAAVPVWREAPGPAGWWTYLTFTWNLILPGYPTFHAFSHVWSLCVEEHFYLVLPMLILVLMRRPRVGVTVALLVGIVLGGIALRSFLLFHGILPPSVPEDDRLLLMMRYLYYPTYSRLDGLVAGVGLAVLRTFRPGWWKKVERHGNLLLLLGLVVTGLAFWTFGFGYPSVDAPASVILGFPLVAAGFGLLVAAAVCPSGVLQQRVPGARFLATISFSMYLTHKAVAHVVHVELPGLTGGADWRSAVTLATGCLLAAGLLYVLVERPFLLLRARQMRGGTKGHNGLEGTAEREARIDPGV